MIRPQSIYEENGYPNRKAYLTSLVEDRGFPMDAVQLAADLLGPEEDFDGLINMLEDEDFGLY